MKNILLIVILLSFCFADTVYYNADFKMINCKVISIEENEYIVQTFIPSGTGQMNLAASIVDAVDYQPIDSTKLTEVIRKTKNDEIIVTEINRIQNNKFKEEQTALKRAQEEKKEQIQEIKINDNQPVKGDYYIKNNIPLLATGIALSTHGLINLISTGRLNKLINEYETSGVLPNTYIDELRSDLTEAYLYGALFTIAGAIDIYFSFEKVAVEIDNNGLSVSYNF